jgi:hypothetical protein|tara:strand:+ start:5849 stop:6148 length:300 start_codon:yes stop_codon:yes gene_type:complete
VPDSLSHFDLPLAAATKNFFAAVGVFVHFRRFLLFPSSRRRIEFFVLTKIVLDARDDDSDIKDQELEGVMAAMMVIVMVIWRCSDVLAARNEKSKSSFF